MTIKLHAMVVALAVRDACKRDVEKDRPIDNLYIDAIVERALREAAGKHVVGDGTALAMVLSRPLKNPPPTPAFAATI
ncbi:hypothetical protein [[Acidovorax] ebreus]|uniref:Uncharacterized protein n=1 Tax=Acidovorax ebreus (strain TPSY) TaxID=535289 RepID=A0A9J9UAN0_ACIET|nr:hypothetical protein [[Acidovorax] ebreus]ACM33579.1 hypothetical protein Dtpsy_2125 [[Acidovorax] ebreus TPSY]